MIQRKQTLFLLLAALGAGAMFFLPLAWFIGGVEHFTLRAFHIVGEQGEHVTPTLYLGILIGLSTLLPFVTIFLYRRRLLQVRLCVVEFVLLVGTVLMGVLYYGLTYRSFAQFDFHAQGIGVGLFLPLAAMLFNWLAVRGIYHDELLVRSADRIR